MKIRTLFKMIVAILFILLGTTLLLSNIGIISVEIAGILSIFWPVVFLIVGIKLLFNRLRKRGGSWTVGSFLLIYGSLLLVGQFGTFTFAYSDVWRLWPLLFIYIGMNFLQFSKKKKESVRVVSVGNMNQSGSSTDYREKHFVGNQRFTQENWKVEPMDLWSGVGDYRFDFTKAFIPEKETSITIRGWVGDIKMMVPEDLAFNIEATANVGDIQIIDQKAEGLNKYIMYETPDYGEASKKLKIKLDFQVGDIRVDRV
ncbi:cell wall-active antibiotics response protein LiaF [Salirhabdus salicampi]|uniref:cell wall-active antibiotics response protein LiaF n=1 Tax=Salirhabdus salicampi TaxID=476102 RepID=UPI0020C52EF2|nr:cell wall-active antibiotics response protein LiaF [Salirhabdus salicampi]MCP8615518.1 cell wall-active antibiotics response protein LiaF [Salirhabdus salicampi]